MTEQTITEEEAGVAAETLRHTRGHLNFQNRANRDAVYRAAKARRIGVRRSSIRNQLLDPRYTYEGQGPDKGLANDYRHHFSVLYTLAREGF